MSKFNSRIKNQLYVGVNKTICASNDEEYFGAEEENGRGGVKAQWKNVQRGIAAYGKLYQE